MPLKRRIYLDPALIRARSQHFPLITEILGERLTAVLDGKQRRADAAPGLLRLLEQSGDSSLSTLRLFEEGLAYFGERRPRGWDAWRSALPGAPRIDLESRYFELLVAMWFAAAGFDVEEFEPPGASGRRADLLVTHGRGSAIVEATSPVPHRSDWIERAMDQLSLGLSRVESGLIIEVDGYDSVTLQPNGQWHETRAVTPQEIENLIDAFAKAAERIDRRALPQVVIAPTENQPVTVTATAALDEAPSETGVMSSWSQSGVVPHVERLANKILDERRHLPDEPSSIVLVDLSRWQDFRNADYYLRQVGRRIAGRTSPAAIVGTCVAMRTDGVHRLGERAIVASDTAWEASAFGSRFVDYWSGERLDHELPSEAS